MKNIVVLDGYTLNPGDLSWAPLQQLGSVTIYERTQPHQIPERAKDAHIILTNKAGITPEIMDQLPQLQGIVVTATGTNIIDIEAASQRKIPVLNAKGYSTESVAQMVFGLILHLILRIDIHDSSVKAGDWSKQKDFCYWLHPMHELSGKTLGIYGYGTIGKAVAKIGAAFGMKILALGREGGQPVPEKINAESLPNLFSNADVISLHAPLTASNAGIINYELLSKMKPSGILINTARGGLIVESDLHRALLERKIFAAGLDVLNTEPPAADHPLFSNPFCILTPHIAWTSIEARQKLMEITLENVRSLL
jgi:glycerate dehydrogenase